MLIEHTTPPGSYSIKGVTSKEKHFPKALISLLLNGLQKSIKHMQAEQKKAEKELKKSMKDR